MPVNVITEKKIAIPEGVRASLKDRTLSVSGPKGSLSRAFAHPKIRVEVGKEEIMVISVLDIRAANGNNFIDMITILDHM